MRTGSRSVGFTILESLIAIAIIATLTAILMPVFARAKEAVHRSSAIQSARQVSTAAVAYAADSDGLFPNHLDDANYLSSLNEGKIWPEPYNSWIQLKRVFKSLQPYGLSTAIRSPRAKIDPEVAARIGPDFFGWRYNAFANVPRPAGTALFYEINPGKIFPASSEPIACALTDGSAKMLPLSECQQLMFDPAMPRE